MHSGIQCCCQGSIAVPALHTSPLETLQRWERGAKVPTSPCGAQSSRRQTRGRGRSWRCSGGTPCWYTAPRGAASTGWTCAPKPTPGCCTPNPARYPPLDRPPGHLAGLVTAGSVSRRERWAVQPRTPSGPCNRWVNFRQGMVVRTTQHTLQSLLWLREHRPELVGQDRTGGRDAVARARRICSGE